MKNRCFAKPGFQCMTPGSGLWATQLPTVLTECLIDTHSEGSFVFKVSFYIWDGAICSFNPSDVLNNKQIKKVSWKPQKVSWKYQKVSWMSIIISNMIILKFNKKIFPFC